MIKYLSVKKDEINKYVHSFDNKTMPMEAFLMGELLNLAEYFYYHYHDR